MTKSETREATKVIEYGQTLGADYMARGLSGLIRSARTAKSRDELITIAAGYPAVTQSPEFIIG
jgi:hypothetical protein